MDLAADFAAAIRGVPKEDLLSQELREQKRALTLAWSAAASLLFLAVLATWQWREAVAQRDRAESTLAAATRSANNFILKVAIRVRQTVGIPVDLVREILAQAQDLQAELIKHNERDPNLQRSRAIALRETSQTLLFQGDTEAALDQALKARTIMDTLIAAQPTNPELRQELSLTHNRVGEALARAGRREEALDSFQKSLSIRQTLAAAATTDNEAKRALALSYERVGDELFNLGRRERALEAYQAALSSREQLVSSQPDKPEWQADLAVSYDRIGRSLGQQREEALAVYEKSLAIRERLVAVDARNALWQRDLATSCDNVGMIHLAAGRREQALEFHRRALAIRQRLAAGDPGNPQWQTLLVISLVKLAEAGDNPTGNYKQALPIVQQLERDGKLAAGQRGWRAEIESRLAKLSGSN
jgi:tetratricopeptide (TPR) repeat protein